MERYLCRDAQTGEALGMFPSKQAAAICLGDGHGDNLALFRVSTGEDSANGTLSLKQVYIGTAA